MNHPTPAPQRRCGPWATAFGSSRALVQAEEALRRQAVERRDLAPIVRFASVYGSGPDAATHARGFGIDPENPYAADGSANYIDANFTDGGLVYGIYRPVQGLAAEGTGPGNGQELANTTLYPYPFVRVDPTTVPLSELGLDITGIDRRFVHFCAGPLGVEAADDIAMLRQTFPTAWPDYRNVIDTGLRHVFRERPLSVRQWYDLTYIPFDTDDQLALYIAQVITYLFGDNDRIPVAPGR
ncbi:hypothetical protein ACIRL2_32760 [Embleya sp. NPDC127516]|uniref:hypothetical protein n=1 Tax=Embleya sp. NPDC127516 TaxID=3363990 RepID=UPI00382DAC9E